MLLKQHLDMIGRNEPIQRKAKFWQSYVRALKDDPHYLSEDAEDAHQRRMDAISELLPMKYRYPSFYHPARSSSVPPPPRSSSVPPTTLRALSRARSSTPAPPHLLRDILEERFPEKPIYTYTGNVGLRLLQRRSYNDPYCYTGNLNSMLQSYKSFNALHYYNFPCYNMRLSRHGFDKPVYHYPVYY